MVRLQIFLENTDQTQGMGHRQKIQLQINCNHVASRRTFVKQGPFTDNESNYSPKKGHWVKGVLRVGKLLAQVVIADYVLFYRNFTASNGDLAQLGY